MMRFPTPHCWHPLYAGETGDLLLYQFSPTKFRWGQYKKGKLFSYYLSPSNYIFHNGLFYKLRQRPFSTWLNRSIGSHFPAGWPRRRFGRRSPAGPISASPATYLYRLPLLLRRGLRRDETTQRCGGNPRVKPGLGARQATQGFRIPCGSNLP